MHLRERIGLAFLIAAFAVAPFGYWISYRWALVSVALVVPALILIWTGRVARRFEASALDPRIGADAPPGPHGLYGFHGADVLDQGGHSDAADGHH